MSEYETPVNDAAETDSVNSETTATAEAPSNANDDLTGGLEQELEQVKAQAQQYLEGWQRERAEFAN
ncbi:MAG: nucleotide exchange factor GrpE, partial [Anaerolineae bacterium]|nr:nucleotide exchange factor GrpE [Anaerolineae bacterium]